MLAAPFISVNGAFFMVKIYFRINLIIYSGYDSSAAESPTVVE